MQCQSVNVGSYLYYTTSVEKEKVSNLCVVLVLHPVYVGLYLLSVSDILSMWNQSGAVHWFHPVLCRVWVWEWRMMSLYN